MKTRKQINVAEMEFNDDLVGYILTLDDGRTVQIQFNVQQNRLHADYGTHYPVIDKQNSYDLDITEDEEEQIKEFIRTNKIIRAKAEEFDSAEEN